MERDLMTLAIPSPLVSCPPGSPQGSLFVVGSQAPVSPRLTWIYAFLRSLSMCLQLSLGNGEQTQDKTAFPLPHFLPKDTASTNSDALTLLHHMIERILESLPLTAPLTLKSEESHRLEETLQAFTTFAHSALSENEAIPYTIEEKPTGGKPILILIAFERGRSKECTTSTELRRTFRRYEVSKTNISGSIFGSILLEESASQNGILKEMVPHE